MLDLSLTAFDVGVFLVLGVSVLLALARGAVRELLGLLVWVGALVIAYVAFDPVRWLMLDLVHNDWMADGLALLLVFVVPLVVLKVSLVLVAGFAPVGLLGLVDRLAGGAYGLARGLVMVSAGYLGLSFLINPVHQPLWIQDATVLPYVQDGAGWIAGWLPPSMLPETAFLPPGAGPEPTPAAEPRPVWSDTGVPAAQTWPSP